MILKETVVYVEITEFNENKVPIIPAKFLTYPHTEEPHLLEKWNGYFFTKEELVGLLGSVFQAGKSRGVAEEVEGIHIDRADDTPDEEQFINSLFNTEEDGL
jgi:hypothetical protein